MITLQALRTNEYSLSMQYAAHHPVLRRAVEGLGRRDSGQELERHKGGWLGEDNPNALRMHIKLPKNKLC